MEKKVKSLDDFNNLIDLAIYFKEEKTCLQYLEQWVHKGDIKCPHCGLSNPYRYKDGKLFACSQCRVQFTAKVGTVFQNSRLPLVKWFMALYLFSANKKGVSAIQLGKAIGVSRKTAWIMGHKIRESVNQNGIVLEGVVQSDETFVGGKNKNRHIDKKAKYSRNKWRESPDKAPVIGLIDSNGIAKTQVLQAATLTNIKSVVMESVKAGSTWVTDNYLSVRTLGKYFKREVVNHQKKQFLSKRGHSTNAIENLWSHFKRMIIGTYHKVSQKHLQRYCNELTFRFNTRHLKEGERLALLFSKVNCVIPYKKLIR